MTDSSDDILTRPLGVDVPAPGPKAALARLRACLATLGRSPRAVAAGLGGLGLAVLGLVLLLGDPKAGEPRVQVAIVVRETMAAAGRPPSPEAAAANEPAPASKLQSSAVEVESASGVTVVRAGGSAAPAEAVVIRVPQADAPKLAPAPDPRLTERGRHGVLPKLGDGRIRPLDVYARSEEPGSGPRIAILLTGLGVGQAATASAIVKLPPAVSLAFSPYGADAERSAARARAFGHEILLQAPMEPFDYPDSDPGPQGLLTAAKGSENADRLAWVMSRFSGYVGVTNFMGAKFMADAVAFEPVLRDIATRGLGFLDDGTNARGVPADLLGKTKVPAARAEIVFDAVPRPEAIDRELARLEAQARANGFALASGSAQPMTIERIARWSRELEGRGIRLVPASVALRGAKAVRVTKAD
ncbi:divergent polysaccharide deacetylase family protein [Methylobacterium sp. E-025]|nr:divergent polysaccharide deacetylase family protein [Methylobacterium sp. E-025]MCJ2113960.1 divergent polysaccharide deacetylase family protein [Methylobacterium sp. E-025]